MCQRLKNSDKNEILRVHNYLIIACTYAGNAVNFMIDHLINCVVYAGIIAQQRDRTKSKFQWNQIIILCLEKGARVIKKIKILKRYILKQN